MKFFRLLFASLLLATAPTTFADFSEVPSGTYTLDRAHGYLNFSYLHLGFSRPIIGFKSFTVDLELDAKDVTSSKLTVAIDPASIDSWVEIFDDYLRSDRFFNIEEFPKISFVATAIEMTIGTSATVTGDLTIKAITKPVSLEVTINRAGVHPRSKKPVVGISATGTLLRSEWDLGQFAPSVGDEVTLNIQVELVFAK
jgi:polyisoprenoid-binding protein YceI